MDEQTWLATDDACAMLDTILPNDSLGSVEPQPRKSRLYLIACARRAWDRLPGVCRAMVALAEQVYGGRQRADREFRARSYHLAESLVHCRGQKEDLAEIARALVEQGHAAPDLLKDVVEVPHELWTGFAHLAFFPFDQIKPYFRRIPRDIHSADLVREVFGNPFRRISPMRDEWRTRTVQCLAEQVEETQDFTSLPILADALEDAGCNERSVLDHLRQRSGHVRGCWAVEWVTAPPALRFD